MIQKKIKKDKTAADKWAAMVSLQNNQTTGQTLFVERMHKSFSDQICFNL